MIDRDVKIKNLPLPREQKCRDCKQPFTFRYFTRLDSNKKPVKSWRCAFDDTKTKYKHRCKQAAPVAVSPAAAENMEIAA